MATEREQDILQLIQQNPLISQQEIAHRCGITRSSVAVHISNLMKKGLIQGKGYVLHTAPYVAVVGGATLDIRGFPTAPLVLRDSNPGAVTMSAGGVGRNIAHNLALLGQDVKFLSAFGDDANAAPLMDGCREAGIDISHSPVIHGGSTSVYLFITSHRGEMELAVSDMEIYERITPDFLADRMSIINRAQLCITDTNIPGESLRYLAEHCKVPLFADTVSTAKTPKLAGLLNHLHTLKPNRIEAQLLTGIEIQDEESLAAAAQYLLDAGLSQVFISLGEEGVYCANKKETLHLPIYPGPVLNTTGAGDAFMAALAWAWLQDLSLADSAKAGLAAASLCIASADTISPNINEAALREKITQ